MQADDEVVAFNVNADNNQNVTVAIDEQILKNKPSFAKYFRQVFHKAAYCAGCKVCGKLDENTLQKMCIRDSKIEFLTYGRNQTSIIIGEGELPS